MSDEGTTPPPVATLDYSYRTDQGRPGILTAVGVMSIVVACLSGLGSLGSAFSSVSYYIMARMPPATFAAPMPMPTTTTTTAPTTAASGGATSIVLPSYTATYSATAWTVTPGGGGAATTMPATAPTFTGNPFAGISFTAIILSFLAALLSFGLAIYLLVAGIQVLRDSPGGAKLHWWYVKLKIPLVIFASAVGLWLSESMMSGMAASMPAGMGGGTTMAFQRGMMIGGAVMSACFALAYPVALIFVLRSKSVREFYNTVRP